MRSFASKIPPMKETLTLHEPSADVNVMPTDVRSDGAETYTDHTGFYCTYMRPRARDAVEGEALIQSTSAALIVNYEPLMDRVTSNWKATVLDRLYRVVAPPEVYVEDGRFVLIRIELEGNQ